MPAFASWRPLPRAFVETHSSASIPWLCRRQGGFRPIAGLAHRRRRCARRYRRVSALVSRMACLLVRLEISCAWWPPRQGRMSSCKLASSDARVCLEVKRDRTRDAENSAAQIPKRFRSSVRFDNRSSDTNVRLDRCGKVGVEGGASTNRSTGNRLSTVRTCNSSGFTVVLAHIPRRGRRASGTSVVSHIRVPIDRIRYCRPHPSHVESPAGSLS
jgi:hypothetical protein